MQWLKAVKESKKKRFFRAVHDVMVSLYNALYGFVLHSFQSMNRKIWSKLPLCRMEEETKEHIHSLVKAFKWIVLPASLLYVFANYFFFGENSLDSMLWGILIFCYSNFLPDLPSIYRRKKDDESTKDLSWYKKYALLLLAPLLVWILFSGIQLTWRTTETFHNFKSLSIYGAFLLLLGFFAFVKFPVTIGNATEILSILFYGVTGYLTHLKVDKIW